MRLEPWQIDAACRVLDVNEPDLVAVRHCPDRGAAREQLEALKARARKKFRSLALELHPDVNGGDAAKTERFKVLSFVLHEIIERIELDSDDHIQVGPDTVLGGGRGGIFGPGFRRAMGAALREAFRYQREYESRAARTAERGDDTAYNEYHTVDVGGFRIRVRTGVRAGRR